MARFYFNLRSSTLHRGAVHALVSQRTLRALNLADEDDDADRPLGPGWFGSSWDLQCGLEVHEGLLPSDAPAHDWLALCLRLRAVRADSDVAAERHEQPGARLVPAAAHGAIGDTVQFGDFGFAVAAEVTHLDEFSQFGIDGLELA
jgi:hypothetical protein